MLAGDPVAAGELLAAPSADALDGIAVCLLDVDREAQAERLAARGDHPALFVHHAAFAEWMRAHARDPGHMPHVLQVDGWGRMRWERWPAPGEELGWAMQVLDTSHLTADQVAARLLDWCRRALAGHAPVMRPRADVPRADAPGADARSS